MSMIDNDKAKEILQAREQNVESVKKIQEEHNLDYRAETNEDGNLVSLGKSKMMEEKNNHKDFMHSMASEIGWKKYPAEYLPSKGMFYPNDIEITIRSANVQEIRHFSTIEEDDVIDIDEKLSFILEKCCRVKMNGTMSTFKDLVDIDRFALVFAIRELTFKEGENKLQMVINCDQCGHSDTLIITKEIIQLFELDDELKPFYNPERLCITLVANDGEEIDIFIPSVGVSQSIKNIIRPKMQKKEYVDKTFIKIAPFLFSNWRMINEKTYNQMNDRTFGWNIDKISKVILAIDHLLDSVTPEISHICSVCGSEVKTPLSFQGGFKALFLYSNALKGLG